VLVFCHALNVEVDQVIGDGIDYRLRHLRAAGIVEKHEIASLADGWKHGADFIDREAVMAGEIRCGRGGAHHGLAENDGFDVKM
jgi:hypothetical protein